MTNPLFVATNPDPDPDRHTQAEEADSEAITNFEEKSLLADASAEEKRERGPARGKRVAPLQENAQAQVRNHGWSGALL